MTRFIAISSVSFLIIACGCQSQQDYDTQRADNARRHFEIISQRGVNSTKTYDLASCIGDALANNLDLKVEELQIAVAKERKTAALLGMLPQLTYQWNLTTRTNEPGAQSIDLKTGNQSLQTSRSSEKTEHTHKVELAYSLIDFGMAYFNSVQAQDNILLADTQKSRVAQNLSLEVAKAFFEVAATQDAINTTDDLLKRCKGIDTIFENLKDAKTLSRLRVLDERKRFINLEKSLMLYQRNHETSCLRLRALMGYLPMEELKVDTSFLEKYNIAEVPSPDDLEKVALRKRPELSELDIQAHINVVEARKTILTMLPNVKIFTDFTNSSNPFLYHQSWWEIGMRAAYDLLKLPSKVMRYQSLTQKNEELEMRTKALSIAVMAQVRIAYVDLLEAKSIYEYRSKVFNVYVNHLEVARKTFGSGGGALSKFELDRMELETAERRIRMTQALGDCYLSYYRLLNTVGVSEFNPEEIKNIVKSFNQDNKSRSTAAL